MEHGAWSMEQRAWSKEHGAKAWSKEHGAKSMEQRAWSKEHGAIELQIAKSIAVSFS